VGWPRPPLLHPSSHHALVHRAGRSRRAPVMKILPVKREVLDRLVPFWVTPMQLEWLGGSTDREKFEVVLQNTFVAFLGLWGSYFISFVVGSPLATVCGAAFAMNGLFRPIVLAYQRAIKVRGYDPDVPHIAGLFSGEVVSCEAEVDNMRPSVLKLNDVSPGSPLPLLESSAPIVETTLAMQDEEGRRLVVRAPQTKAHKRVQPGMRVEVIIFAEGLDDFEEVSGATDAYIPEAGVWFGSYPYLDRNEFKSFLAARDRRTRRRSRARRGPRRYPSSKVWQEQQGSAEAASPPSRKDFDGSV